MSKLVAFLVAAAGASTVSVGGTFLLKKGGGGTGSEGKSQDKQAGQTPEQLTLYEGVTQFQNPKGDSCVHELFGKDLDMSSSPSGSTEISANQPATSNTYFGELPTNDEGKTKGCLIINWKKTSTTSGDKGKGTFTGSWSFMNKDKGFIVFVVAKTNESNQKMDVTGVTYLLEEENGSPSKGKIKYHKEVNSGKEISSSTDNLESKLLKSNSAIQKDLEEADKSFWGFISGKDDLGKICGTSDCSGSDNKSSSKAYKWKWKRQTTGGTQSIGSGCDKLDWWKQIFDENSFDLSSKLNSFTSGQGEKQQVSPAQ